MSKTIPQSLLQSAKLTKSQPPWSTGLVNKSPQTAIGQLGQSGHPGIMGQPGIGTPQITSNYEIEMMIPNIDDKDVNKLCEVCQQISYNLKDKTVQCQFNHIIEFDIEQIIDNIALYGLEQLILKPKGSQDNSSMGLFVGCLFGECISHNCVYDTSLTEIVAHKFEFKFYTIRHIHKNTKFNNDSIVGRLLNSLKELYILQNC